jgi:hypothetical protein
MLSHRMLYNRMSVVVPPMSRNVGGPRSKLTKGILQPYFNRNVLWRGSSPQLQCRTSIFSRGKIIGDQGLQASSVPVGRTSSVTWSRIAFYVKVVRIPFLIVAIYGLGYKQGITDTFRNPLKLQQVSHSLQGCRRFVASITWCLP